MRECRYPHFAFVSLVVLHVTLLVAMPVSGQLIVGHRGASHAAPENTLAAFDLAWQEGADGAEGDFRLTRDGRIVCIHDEDTERTAGKKLVVATTTLAELQQLDVGSWKDPRYAGERPPTLREVLDSVPEGKRFFIELKTGPEIVAPLKKVLAESPVPIELLIVIAFDENTASECKRQIPEIKTHWLTSYQQRLTGNWTPNVAGVLQALARTKADGLGSKAEPRVFNAKFVAELLRKGPSEYHVWTVDDPQVAEFYIHLGVWSITTNRPGWLREQLGAARR